MNEYMMIVDTEELKKEIKKCFKEHKELDDKLMCSFDKVADVIERNSELIEDNTNISKGILNIVKGNAKMLEDYKDVIKQIPEMYELFNDIKDELK